MYIVTELVTPLELHIKTHQDRDTQKELAISWGLHQITASHRQTNISFDLVWHRYERRCIFFAEGTQFLGERLQLNPQQCVHAVSVRWFGWRVEIGRSWLRVPCVRTRIVTSCEVSFITREIWSSGKEWQNSETISQVVNLYSFGNQTTCCCCWFFKPMRYPCLSGPPICGVWVVWFGKYSTVVCQEQVLWNRLER